MNFLASLFGGNQQDADEPTSRAIALFLAGHSVPQIAACDRPGTPMIEAQRAVESDIRDYIYQLEAQISELQSGA